MNWMKHLSLYFVISALVIVPGIYSLVRYGLKPSIEFTGGSRLTLVSVTSSPDTVLQSFKDYTPQLEISDDTSLSIKSKEISQENTQKIIDGLKKENPDIKLTDFETIGPSLGQETIKKTANALIIASLLLLAYISFQTAQIRHLRHTGNVPRHCCSFRHIFPSGSFLGGGNRSALCYRSSNHSFFFCSRHYRRLRPNPRTVPQNQKCRLRYSGKPSRHRDHGSVT